MDGQQRLTTLTLLLAALRERVSAKFADPIDARIFQKGDPIKKTIDQPRLQLRDRDQPFFEKNIQQRDGITGILAREGTTLTDSQQCLLDNTVLLLNRLDDLSIEECERLDTFVDQHTFLVVVSTEEFESAYRIFTVLNERGMDLTHTDILKSEIIGRIPEPEQDLYTEKWENAEEDLGRESFADLFSHIRMIFAKNKARESHLKGFRSAVVADFNDSRKLIDEVVVPFSNAFATITRHNHVASSGAEEVNDLLGWLNELDNIDWIPPTMKYFSLENITTSEITRFLTDLEGYSGGRKEVECDDC